MFGLCDLQHDRLFRRRGACGFEGFEGLLTQGATIFVHLFSIIMTSIWVVEVWNIVPSKMLFKSVKHTMFTQIHVYMYTHFFSAMIMKVENGSLQDDGFCYNMASFQLCRD